MKQTNKNNKSNKKKMNKFVLRNTAIGLALVIMICLAFVVMTEMADQSTSLNVFDIDIPTEVLISEKPTSTPEPTPTPEPTEDLTGKAINPMTGLSIDENVVNRRPFAVVINNLKKALPQSGIAQADIYYEVLAEADITRIIAIFQDFDSQKIGPVRSMRHYFLNFAGDNDAIFVHHGGSDPGYEAIVDNKFNNIDGMKFEGPGTFWRDPQRVKISGMMEHSSYTNAEKLLERAEKLKYRFEKPDDFKGMFDFYEKLSSPDGKAADTVKVPFSSNQDATFSFDAETGLYKRYEFGNEQIDEETGGGLAVSNVLVQYVEMYVIKGDKEGRREVKLVGSGDGLLITAGKAVPVTWQKKGLFSPTEWLAENGDKLTINKGKTWVCVVNKDTEVGVE